jgi:coiled-coil domain-containing protein 39
MSNRETKLAINDLNNTSSNLRAQYTIYNDAVLLKTNELTTQRKTLQVIAEQLANGRNKNRRAKAEECEKEDLVQKGVTELERMAAKVEGYRAKSLTAQERLKQLEEIIGSEERNIKVLDDESVRLSGTLFRAQQQLMQLQEQQKILNVSHLVYYFVV